MTNMIMRIYSLLALLVMGSVSNLAQETDPFGEVDVHKYPNTMTITGYVRMNGVVLGSETVVAVYQGDELRGKSSPFTSGNYTNLLMLSIYGETKGEPLLFKIYTGGKVVEVDQGLTFATDQRVGTLSEPYYIDIGGLKGDVNEDGTVSIFDAVQVVNYILGKSPTPFCFNNADMDDNGEITIYDAVSIVNVILQQGSGNTTGGDSQNPD